MRRPILCFALAAPLVFVACSGERPADSRTTASEESARRSSESGPAKCGVSSADPWTSGCSAQWVREIVEAAGYRITGETGSAWVAARRGTSFYIWATRPPGSRKATAKTIAQEDAYRLVRRVSQTPVYGDGVRKLWQAKGFIFWVEAGPRGDSIAPTAAELEALIRASRRLPPPAKIS